MNYYVVGQCDAALLFGLEKEAALDFLGPEVAKYMRRALLAIPIATGATMSQMPPAVPTQAQVVAYRGTPQHYADTQQYRGSALMNKIKAEQAATPNAHLSSLGSDALALRR